MSSPTTTSSLDDTIELSEIAPELRARLEKLSPEKRALALQRLQSRSAAHLSERDRGPTRVDREGDLPVSFAQERLWVLHEMDGDDPSYNIPAALVLNGNLQVEALEDALRQIVSRHEALRTRFSDRDGAPIQKIETESRFDLHLEDLTHLPALDRENEARRQARCEIVEPFNLRKGPLIRGRLIRIAPNRHVLLLTVHHIVADGWSMGILVKELEAFYRARIAGETLSLQPLPVQCADVAVWQRSVLESGESGRDIQFWEQQLKDAPDVLDLPSDRPRPPVKSSRGGTVRFEIDRALAQNLAMIARESGATSNMILLAPFSSLESVDRTISSSAPRWPGEPGRSWSHSLGSLSIPFLSAADSMGIPHFKNSLVGSGKPLPIRLSTSICPSRDWSRSCSRYAIRVTHRSFRWYLATRRVHRQPSTSPTLWSPTWRWKGRPPSMT